MNSTQPTATAALAIALSGMLSIACAAQALAPSLSSARSSVSPAPSPTDNDELKAIHDADQAARENLLGTVGDEALTKLLTEDRARRARVLEIYKSAGLNTGADHFHAAGVLQHGEEAADYLLAHELAVAAVVLGDKRGISLAAVTEDRFLRRIGRPQRFGTQFSSPRGFAGPGRLTQLRRA